MKRFAFAAGLLASVASLCLQAQAADLQASIPFEFRMGTSVMPAGDYKIYQTHSGLVTLRKLDGQPKSVGLLTIPASRKTITGEGSLQFNRYGDTYVLTSVWNPSSHEGRALHQSVVEKELIGRSGQVQTAGIPLRRN